MAPMGYFFLLSLGVGSGLQTHWSTSRGSICSRELSQPLGVRPKYCLLPTLHSGPGILSNPTPTQNVSRSDSQDSPYVMCKLWETRRGHAPGLVRPKRVHGRHTAGWFLPQSSTRVTGWARSSACRGRSAHLELRMSE